jgi:hypothetical protein
MVWQQGSKHLQQQQPALVATPQKKGSSSSSAAAGLGGAKLPSKSSAKGSSSKSSSAAKKEALQQQQQHSGKHSSSSAAADAAHSSGSGKPEWLLSNLILEAQRQLAMGTLRLMMALPLVKLYAAPELPFNSEAQRFDQRFAAFHQLQRPEPLTYEQFVTSTSVEGVEAGQLLRLAGDSFKRVSCCVDFLLDCLFLSPSRFGLRSKPNRLSITLTLSVAVQAIICNMLLCVMLLQAQQACGVALKGPSSLPISKQQEQDLKAMDRVAATNSVAVMLLGRTAVTSSNSNGTGAAAAGPQLKPHYEFAVSKNFPTLTLKSAAAAGAAAK